MLHYINMPIKHREWLEDPRNHRTMTLVQPYSRISRSEAITAARYRREYEANETRKMMEVHNDIRAIS